jgi:hypothetical protein
VASADTSRPAPAAAGSLDVNLTGLAIALPATADTIVSPRNRWVVDPAGAGEEDRVLVEGSGASRAVRLSETAATIDPSRPRCAARSSEQLVGTFVSRVRLVQADLEDPSVLADAITLSTAAARADLVGDAGTDHVLGHGSTGFDLGGDAGEDIGDDALLDGSAPGMLRRTPGDDVLDGGGGDDELVGNAGDASRWGGGGLDRLFGCEGADLLNAAELRSAPDAVVSYESGAERGDEDAVDRLTASGCERVRFRSAAGSASGIGTGSPVGGLSRSGGR